LFKYAKALLTLVLRALKMTSVNLSNEHFRAMIFYDFKSGMEVNDCLERLRGAFGETAPSRTTVHFWFNEFKRGRLSLEDSTRSGRPCDVTTPEMVLRVRKMVEEDRHVTYSEIQQTLNIGSATVNTILHDHLGLRKLTSRWIPHLLTAEQKATRVDWCHFMLHKYDNGRSRRVSDILTGDETWLYQYDPETKDQSTVWVFDNELPPTKVVRSRSTAKQMLAVFFRRSGLVTIVPLREQRTVNAEWYCTVCLPAVFNELRKSRPRTGIRGTQLHHDNASAHTAARTLDFLSENGVQLVTHPAYSPDLAPNDFFLFPKVKHPLRGQRFSNPEDALNAFQQAVQRLSDDEWHQCFQDWFERMRKCIQASGNYFEKI
jgi:histone-lysine N-methyltransferase SETMAR